MLKEVFLCWFCMCYGQEDFYAKRGLDAELRSTKFQEPHLSRPFRIIHTANRSQLLMK